MHWLIFGVLAASCFGFYNLFIKLSSDKFSPAVSLMFLTGAAFLIALIATISLKVSGKPILLTKSHIALPILAGVSTALAEILYFTMYTKGAPLGVGTVFVVGGTMIVATLLGVLILKEPLNLVKILGMVLLIAGLFLLTK